MNVPKAVSRLSAIIFLMVTPNFKLINGDRDQLESNLTKALFGESDEEINKRLDLLNATAKEKPQLSLIQTPKPSNIKR